ncbi:MAG: hypothetical protein Q4G62_09895, partial [Pseudomonadota bacterium]|nr:hypothetical protein [Pseudomonadota bacterium]
LVDGLYSFSWYGSVGAGHGKSIVKTARGWSWMLAAASLVLPGAYFFWEPHRFSQWATDQDGPVCGMALLGAFFFALLLAAALSVSALVCAIAGFRKLPAPRPQKRWLELLLVALPAIVLALGVLVSSMYPR